MAENDNHPPKGSVLKVEPLRDVKDIRNIRKPLKGNLRDLAVLFLDLVMSIYQRICFPVYGIPKVRRGDYIVIDRQYLSYLNITEQLNCIYCGYFNGVMGYTREIAGQTEQYWCPIKHARKIKALHTVDTKIPLIMAMLRDTEQR
ncbi:MAG: hypothetical protein ACI9UO_003027 [Nitrospinales bacterium]|jgi:hypothetical protein